MIPKREPDGSLAITKQDLSAPAIEYYLTQKIQAVTLAATTTIGSNTVTLAPGHGFIDAPTASDHNYFLEIKYVDATDPESPIVRLLQSEVRDVVGNVLTLSKPFGTAMSPTHVESAYRTNANLALAVGSPAAPVRFSVSPPDGLSFDIIRYITSCIMTAAGDDAKFASGSPLQFGLVFGHEDTEGTTYGFVIRDNTDLRITGFDMAYVTRSGGGGRYGMAARETTNGDDKSGVVIRIDGAKNGEFFVRVQDNITAVTGLVYMAIKVDGHIVTP